MLTLKRMQIDAGAEHIAYLNRHCATYPADEFHPMNRIDVIGDGARISGTLHVVDDTAVLGADELGLSGRAFEALGLPEGSSVTLEHRSRPESQNALRRKISGAALDHDEIDAIIADMVASRYAQDEIAAFLVAVSQNMNDDEMLALARARARHANRLRWDAPLVVDKHSMGGIPGNRVTMIVVPIVAAHGLTIPKTSSRAITSPAGTADCMEVLARVDLTADQVAEVVARANGCIVWNGRLNHSPVDDVMNRITRPLGLDSRKWSVASILSKKLAAGSTHVVIDLPAGAGAKLHDVQEARALGDRFSAVGHGLGLTLEAHVTDGTKPIGVGIGPVLEARDVMAVLRNDPSAPMDLAEKALDFAGRILEFDPTLPAGRGRARAEELLADGAALASMEKIIELQGPPPVDVGLGTLVHEIVAPADTTISAIDCYQIAGIARRAGAPMDKGAGIDLLKSVGDRVISGEPLYRIHAHIDGDFQRAVEMAEQDSGYN